jgi:hypothetical protein
MIAQTSSNHIHRRQGQFLTVLPRTRSEDSAFRDLLSSGQIQWRHIYDKRNDNGKIVDKYSISEQASLSVEGYRRIWYHSTRKAEQSVHSRYQEVENALIELSDLVRGRLIWFSGEHRSEVRIDEFFAWLNPKKC